MTCGSGPRTLSGVKRPLFAALLVAALVVLAGCGLVRESSSGPLALLQRVKEGQPGALEGLNPAAIDLRAVAAAEPGSLYYLGRLAARAGAVDAAAGFLD